MTTLPTQVQFVPVAEFCRRAGFVTPSGKPAIRRGLRCLSRLGITPVVREGRVICVTEQELFHRCLSREVLTELARPGHEYFTGRTGTHRAVMDVLQAMTSAGLITVNLDRCAQIAA